MYPKFQTSLIGHLHAMFFVAKRSNNFDSCFFQTLTETPRKAIKPQLNHKGHKGKAEGILRVTGPPRGQGYGAQKKIKKRRFNLQPLSNCRRSECAIY